MYAKSFHRAAHSHSREQERREDESNQPQQCCIKKTGTKASNQQIVLPSKEERKKIGCGGTRNRSFGKERRDYSCEEVGDGERQAR